MNAQLKGGMGVKSIRDQSFQAHAPKLFNSLTLDAFKQKLDKFVSGIPYEPNIGDQTPRTCNICTAKPSSSIINQVFSENASFRLSIRAFER